MGLLVERSCLSDDECLGVAPCEAEWEEQLTYEKMNLINAGKLHDLLWSLEHIEHSNFFYADGVIKEHIPDVNDLLSMQEDPQAYEWEFRIFNSY